MAASYPGAIKSFTQQTDGVDIVAAADVNSAYDEIEAVETELGTDVAGSVTNLKTRLIQSIANDGDLVFAAATELTIATGAITITQNWHTVDGEGDANDTLTTINGGAEGFLLFLRPESDSVTITISHDTGNISCVGQRDIVLENFEDFAILIYDAGLTKWLCYSQAPRPVRYIQLQPFSMPDQVDCATGDGKDYVHIPPDLNGMSLVYVHAEVQTAGTTGTMSIQFSVGATDMLSTLLTIDTGETGSDTAAVAAVIKSDGSEVVSTNDLLEVDVDGIHTTPAKGLLITLGFAL